MKEYRMIWCRVPYAHNEQHVIFVKANSPEDARVLAIDHIERKFHLPKAEFGISNIKPNPYHAWMGVIEEAKPMPAGEVL